MLRLLPPLCRDCGKSGREARVAQYLHFHLCAKCVAARESALRVSSDEEARRTQRAAGTEETPPEKAAKPARKVKAKPKPAAGKKVKPRK